MKARLLSLCAVSALLLFMQACARPPAPVEKPVPVAMDSAGLKERSEAWRDFRAKFRLRVESEKARFSARAIVLVKGRNFARFETFGPIGTTAALFVLNETGPSLLIPSEKVIFKAEQPESLINYFLGISLPFEVFRRALTGSIPVEQIDTLETRLEGGVLHAVARVGPRLFDWQFQPGGPELSGIHISDGELRADISYSPPVPLARNTIPKTIRISSPNWSMEVNLEELEPALEFRPSVFYLPNLPEMKTVDLDRIK